MLARSQLISDDERPGQLLFIHPFAIDGQPFKVGKGKVQCNLSVIDFWWI